jgi:hypothetical protein
MMGKLLSEMTDTEIECELRRLGAEIDRAEKAVHAAEKRRDQFAKDVGWSYAEGIGYMPMPGRRAKAEEYHVLNLQPQAGVGKTMTFGSRKMFIIKPRAPRQGDDTDYSGTDRGLRVCPLEKPEVEYERHLLIDGMGLSLQDGDEVEITARVVSRIETKRVPVDLDE